MIFEKGSPLAKAFTIKDCKTGISHLRDCDGGEKIGGLTIGEGESALLLRLPTPSIHFSMQAIRLKLPQSP